MLEAKLKAEHPSWLAFCHNDLQCGNVMLDASSLVRLTALCCCCCCCCCCHLPAFHEEWTSRKLGAGDLGSRALCMRFPVSGGSHEAD